MSKWEPLNQKTLEELFAMVAAEEPPDEEPEMEPEPAVKDGIELFYRIGIVSSGYKTIRANTYSGVIVVEKTATEQEIDTAIRTDMGGYGGAVVSCEIRPNKRFSEEDSLFGTDFD